MATLRKIALWILRWLEGRVDPDLRQRIEEYRETARKLDGTIAAAKKDLQRLDGEWKDLREKRKAVHGELALLELEIGQIEAQVNEIRGRNQKDLSGVDDAAVLRDGL